MLVLFSPCIKICSFDHVFLIQRPLSASRADSNSIDDLNRSSKRRFEMEEPDRSRGSIVVRSKVKRRKETRGDRHVAIPRRSRSYLDNRNFTIGVCLVSYSTLFTLREGKRGTRFRYVYES